MQIINSTNKRYYSLSLLHRYTYKFNINTYYLFLYVYSHINNYYVIWRSNYPVFNTRV